MDINSFRADKGGNPDQIRESQRRRYADVGIVDEIIKLDEEWRKARFAIDQAKKEVGQISKAVGQKKKAGENADDLIAQSLKLQTRVKELEDEEEKKKAAVDAKIYLIGNIVHQSVPVSNDEVNNKVERTWGERRLTAEGLKHHHELLWMIGGYEPDRGTRVAGHRGYYLTGPAVALNQAIIQFGLQFLAKRKYQLIQTPQFMKKDIMAKVAQLSEFDEALYKVGGGPEDEEMYLIATSEQPICGFHLDDWMDPKQLPIRYAGISTCFRKEAGKHGKDTWGIFRTHQFEKVEQFAITSPENSWEMHEEMIKCSEEFYQALGIPYHVVTIVSGELNNAAAKKYDLEGWFPAFQEYRELVSASNCTDYQARRMETRFGSKSKDDKTKKYVHMLNSTLTATGRTICAILENHQTDKGINVPEILHPYLAGYLEDPKFIPFTRKAPDTKKTHLEQPAKAAGAAAPAKK